jgi:hypothetical protein
MMKNDINITDVNEGVGIRINGDVKFKDIEAMTQNCSDGSCDCSPKMIAKINDIQVSGKDGDVNITLQGKGLKAKEVESCMSGGCDCGF